MTPSRQRRMSGEAGGAPLLLTLGDVWAGFLGGVGCPPENSHDSEWSGAGVLPPTLEANHEQSRMALSDRFGAWMLPRNDSG